MDLWGGGFQLDQLLDSIVHLTDGAVLGEAETLLVGDVVDTSGGFRVLTMNTTDLELHLVANGLELVLVGRDLGELNVDRGADGGAQVGGAEGKPAEAGMTGEGLLGANVLETLDQTVEDFANLAAGLHGDDAEMVLFVDPDEESLLLIVENAAAVGPVAGGIGFLKKTVTFFELKNKEVNVSITILQ